VVLIFTLNDLFVPEVLHWIFLRATKFHLFDEFLLASDASESFVLLCDNLFFLVFIGYVVQELALIFLIVQLVVEPISTCLGIHANLFTRC
jgi:hypothetical protein